MIKRPTRLVLSLSLIGGLLLALGYWNIRPETFFEEPATADSIEPDIDFYAEHAFTAQFREDGSLQYQLTSPKLEHSRDSGNSRVEAPDLLIFRNDGAPWHINSKQAEVNNDGSRIRLIDDARITRMDAKQSRLSLSSDELIVYPEREYAETSAEVRIEAANSVTTARGLQAYLKEGRMLLNSQVRGQHEIR